MNIPNININRDRPVQKIILNENLIIPAPLDFVLANVIQENTFANPKYEDALKYGRYTKNIPSTIETYQLNGSDLIIDRGYYSNLIKKSDVEFEIDDQRPCPSACYPPLNGISLRKYQTRVVEQSSQYSQGIIVAPTGSGKTIMGLSLIREKQTPALILVHKKELAYQWKKEIEKLFGFTPSMIGEGKFQVGDKITIGMSQTLAKRENQCKEVAYSWGLVLVDEAHHCPAEQFSTILGWLPAKYRYGLSATPTRRDGLDCLIFRNIGPIIAKVEKSEVESVRSVVPAKVRIVKTGFEPGVVNSWHEFADALNNAQRNMTILNLIPKDRSCLILCDRIAHTEDIAGILSRRQVDHVLAHGQLSGTERASLMNRIKNSRITVGTTGLLGEGLDVAHWDTLILATPISSEAKLLQAIGRIVRPSQDKKIGLVLDLNDNHPLAGASLKARIAIYEKHGISFEFGYDSRKLYG